MTELTAQELTPSQIVQALDRHIVGQADAKRAVAIAIRNRWRRQQLSEEVRREILPKNLILIGSTGVGKTEIARRVAQLVKAPFIKVEASKYTEVGYYGRDVESMIRDLVDTAIGLVHDIELERVKGRAATAVEDRILDSLVGPVDDVGEGEDRERREKTRDNFRQKLRDGRLEDREVEITIQTTTNPIGQAMSGAGLEQFGVDLDQLLGRFNTKSSQRKRLRIREARRALEQEEAEKLIDQERVQQEGLRLAEESGIIFLDEIDKITSASDGPQHGAQVSREGVQRDLLPIVEGSTVNTRYGMIRTDHILFVGAGAFHGSRPSDLIPELQGRFPIRVELQSLTKEDFVRILREPANALPRQYRDLLETESVQVVYEPDGLERVAQLAWDLNQSQQNIGARRLYALFEKLLEEPLFLAPDALPDAGRRVLVDRAFVDTRLGYLMEDPDHSAYIL